MRTLRDRLTDILEAISKIEVESAKGHDAFTNNELVQIWMVHHLMIIGEAVRSLDPATKQKYPTIPWRQIAGMRNILVHDYFRINREVVWQTVANDLPLSKPKFWRSSRRCLLKCVRSLGSA